MSTGIENKKIGHILLNNSGISSVLLKTILELGYI